MTDIVERLRSVTLFQSYDYNLALNNEAADEILRLRAENERLAKSRDKWGQLYNKALEKLRLAVMSDSDYCKTIEADNERLRAALGEKDGTAYNHRPHGQEEPAPDVRLAGGGCDVPQSAS